VCVGGGVRTLVDPRKQSHMYYKRGQCLEADSGESRQCLKSYSILLPTQEKEKKKHASCSEKRSWTKNLLQLLEMPVSRKIKQLCVLFHKA